MAANPQIPQGVLNRLRGSLGVIDFPELNVTAPFLGTEGMSFAPEGQATGQIPTLTGIVNSPEPYVMGSIVIHLLRTQGLAAQYKQRMELDTQLGDVIVTLDAAPIGTFYIHNTSIESVANMQINGKDAGFALTLKGYWQLNSALWNLQG